MRSRKISSDEVRGKNASFIMRIYFLHGHQFYQLDYSERRGNF